MIREYLADTRLLSKDQPDETSQAFYGPMIAFCAELARKFDQVVITYSAQRKCELVKLGEQRALIYDKNLGQSINTFNRILFFGERSVDAYRPLMRHMADEAILAGQRDLALFLVLKLKEYDDTWNLPPAVSRPDVQAQTYLQELFVFAHEYCHLIGADDPEFFASRSRVGKLLWDPEDKGAPADELRKNWLARYGKAHPAKEIAQASLSLRRFLEAHEIDLVDELGCDDFAIHVLALWCKTNHVPSIEIFKASFLVMRHVRAINYIRAFVRNLIDGTDASGIDDRVRLLQLRQHRLRAAFPIIIETLKFEDANSDTTEGLTAAEVHAEISDLSDQHDKQIDDVLLFELFPGIEKEFRKWKSANKKAIRQRLPPIERIAAVRGWSYGLETINVALFTEPPRAQPGLNFGSAMFAYASKYLRDIRSKVQK